MRTSLEIRRLNRQKRRMAKDLEYARYIKQYGEAWPTFRRLILEERGCRCQYCYKEFKNWELEIHHIKKARLFPKLIYDRANVKVACKACHEHAEFYGK